MALDTHQDQANFAQVATSFPLTHSPGIDSGRGIALHLSARRLLVFVFMAVIFMIAARPITDPDFWWHLKTGEYLVQARIIPHTDIFSTVFFGKEWVTHEWLSEIVIYWLYHTLGYTGLIVTFALIVTFGFWIAYQRCASEVGHPYVSGFALILGALAAAPTWGVRPQMFSFVFASIYIALLIDYGRNHQQRTLWWLVPLMIVWVNVHAGFALGLALILLTVIGLLLEGLLSQRAPVASVWKRVRPLLFVGLACFLAVLVNPNGARMYMYPFETLKSQAMMRYIDEWLSPNFHEPMFQALLVMILGTFAALALSKKRVRFLDLFLLLAMTAAALRSARNIPFLSLMAIPLFAEHLWDWLTSKRWGQWLTRSEKQATGGDAILKIVLNLILLAALPLGVMLVRLHRSVANQASVEAQEFPVAAVEFMQKQRPPQPIYNEYGWGGYLIWKLYPDYRVYVDGRADVYGDAFIEEFLGTHAGRTAWKEPLDRYGVRTVLLKPEAALASLLRQNESWNKVFEDRQAVIFIRK